VAGRGEVSWARGAVGGEGEVDGVVISGYPTLTAQLRRLAVASAHVVDGPEDVGSR